MEAVLTENEIKFDFDMMIPNIILPDKTGIEAAQELSREGYKCPIIYVK